MNEKPLHLLILEDNPDDAELAVKELERKGFTIEWSRVDTENAFREAIEKNPDLILADYVLPSFSGMDALKMQQEIVPDIPLIVVSGKIGEEVAVECMKSGAIDYVLKGKLFRLGPAVKRALEEAEEHRAHKLTEKKLKHLNRVLYAVRKVNQLIVTEKDRDRLIQSACNTLIETRGYFNAWIALFDESNQVAKTVESGLGKDFQPMAEKLARGELTICAQKAIKQSGVVVTHDPLSMCGDCPLAHMYEGHAAYTIQLEHEGNIYGIISASIPKEFAGDGEEQRLFKEVARDIAFGLNNIKMERKQKQAEEELLVKNEVFEMSIAANSTSDNEGILTFVNSSFVKIWGYENKEEAIGKPISDFFKFEDEALNIITALNETGVWEGEYTCLKKDGTTFTAHGMATIIKDRSGNKTGYQSAVLDITEQKQTEQALKQSEEQYRTLVESTTDTILMLDTDRNIVSCNQAFVDLFGYEKNEIEEKSIRIIHKTDESFNAFGETTYPAIERSGSRRIEWEFVTKGGATLPVETVISAIKSPDGSIKGYVAIIRDMTEHQRAEQALQESEDRYRDLVENSTDLICTHDFEGNFLWANKAASHITGYSLETFLKMKISDLLVTEYRPYSQDYLTEIKTKGQVSGVMKVKTAVGKTRFWEYHNSLRTKGVEKPIVRGIARDITERKQAERKLRESEERYRRILETTSEGFWVLNAELKTIEVNESLCKMLGYSRDEMLGKTPFEFVDDENRNIFIEKTSKISIIPHGGYEITLKKKNGEDLHTFFNATTIMDKEGKVQNAFAFVTDMTERKHLQAQLYQSQKLEAIGTLAGGVAHDFNNLLTVIMGSAELALINTSKDNDIYRYITEIRRTGERAASLTRQLLAFSRKQIIQPVTLNLNETLTNLEKMLQRLIGEDIDLKTVYSPDLYRIEADPGQIEQIIMNLTVNARDAMPKGGSLTIETASIELHADYFKDHGVENKPGPYVMLAVTDTGKGMDRETQSRIFEPFFTTKERGRGTGLGLSTVYGIVKQNHGHIWVYSEPERGTTFKIYFPRSQKDKEIIKKDKSPESSLKGTETILIVEDDETLCAMTEIILKGYGYNILTTLNGKEALEKASTHKGSIDILLTDVVMPGMDGKELAGMIQQKHPDIKIIYMSGYTDDAITNYGILEEGINFIQKPFSRKGLARKVREALALKIDN